MPDLGYHYEPLDYLINQLALYGTINLTNGAAIGFFGDENEGITFDYNSGPAFISHGTPTELNQLAWYNTVQEGAGWGSIAGWMFAAMCESWGSTMDCRFTRFSRLMSPYGPGDFLSYNSGCGLVGNFNFKDCEFYGGRFVVYSSPYWFDSVYLVLNNCLFSRSILELVSQADYLSLVANNNLFHGGYLGLGDPLEGGNYSFNFTDNLFDRTSVNQFGLTVTHGYNGYLTNCSRLTPTNVNDKVLTSMTYDSGALGCFYQLNNSLLINAGSRTAGAAGLYHYTTLANQEKEAGSTVDIGFHYMALNGGTPVDTDGDGLPDYIEDRNGNGHFDIVTTTETDWKNATNTFVCASPPPGLLGWWVTKEQITLPGANTVAGPAAGSIVYDEVAGYGDPAGYGFDRVGNRRSRKLTDNPNTALQVKLSQYINTEETRFYNYDRNDRIDTDSDPTNANPNYDDNGNTLTGDVTPAQTANDVYDFANRLITRQTTLDVDGDTDTEAGVDPV